MMTPGARYPLLDWLVRTATPAWLDAADLPDEATALRGLPELSDVDSTRAALPALRAAQSAAYHRSGVDTWKELGRGDAALGDVNMARLDAVSLSPLHPAYDSVGAAGSLAWGACRYASHAVPASRYPAVENHPVRQRVMGPGFEASTFHMRGLLRTAARKDLCGGTPRDVVYAAMVQGWVDGWSSSGRQLDPSEFWSVYRVTLTATGRSILDEVA